MKLICKKNWNNIESKKLRKKNFKKKNRQKLMKNIKRIRMKMSIVIKFTKSLKKFKERRKKKR